MGLRVRAGLLGGAGVAVIFGASGAAAYAVTVSYSTVGQFNTGGHVYDNQASIGVGSVNFASTGTWTDNNQNVPSGWIGSEGRMVKSNGALCATTGMLYMPGAGSGWNVATNTICGHGYYFSQGKSAGWNGNGYNYYYTFRTPNLYL